MAGAPGTNTRRASADMLVMVEPLHDGALVIEPYHVGINTCWLPLRVNVKVWVIALS